MGHLSIEGIMTYLDGKATDAEKSKMEAHLAVCASCLESKRQTEALVRLLHEEADFQTPAHLVRGLKDLFPAGPTDTRPAKPFLAQIIALLDFDSVQTPILAGIRATPAAAAYRPPQYIFRAGDIEMDVKIEAAMDNKRITLTGQVMNFAHNAVVRLESDGMVRYRTRTNELGEFSFEVPNDRYDLSVEINGQRIAILDVHSPARTK